MPPMDKIVLVGKNQSERETYGSPLPLREGSWTPKYWSLLTSNKLIEWNGEENPKHIHSRGDMNG